MNRRLMVTIIGGLLACLTLANAAQAEIRYVKAGATGSGTSWSNATGDLRAAMAASQPYDQVWVATGTYTSGDDPDDYFPLFNHVYVIGGFYGDPQNPTARDPNPATNGTILSGDLGENGNNHCVVVVSGAEDPTVLDGFTIRDGYGGYYGSGAGMYIYGSPTIANCRITDCTAPDWGRGGGVYVELGDPTFTACWFQNCRADQGAGIYVEAGTASIFLNRCVFVDNRATLTAAALFNGGSLSSDIVNCAFVNNSALGDLYGGAVANWEASSGSTVRYVNCLFNGNSALGNGAALWNATGSNVAVVNCTLADNACVCGQGGGIYVQGGTTNVVNSVLWGNSDADGVVEAAQIRVNAGTPSVTYSCIQIGENETPVFDDETNTNDDPEFRDPAGPDHVAGTLDDDFRLKGSPLSPCIDVGYNNIINQQYDLDSQTRKVDGDSNSTVVVDMGAYEYQGAVIDCNRNGIADATDIQNSTSADCQPNGVPDECDIANGTSHDCNGNGVPDECEFTADCNHNCVEDATDISQETSRDDNHNAIPDECEFGVSGCWSEAADFDAGTLINVNHGTSGQLQRSTVETTAPLPYLWVAASGRGTVVRVDTEGGQVLGEYRTAPLRQVLDCSVSTANPDPSRTTVDLDGSVWVANRGDIVMIDDTDFGSVAKIGLVVGGTRVNAQGAPDPAGRYLKPPFDYCTCEDRDSDGLIKTSRGLSDILLWDNADGSDSDGGAQTAVDECILRYVRTAGTGTRTVAVDKDNDVWVGGSGNHKHEQLNGFTGVREQGPFYTGECGGYGGVVVYWPEAPSGILWSASGGGTSVMRGPLLDQQNWGCLSLPRSVYGLGVDREGDLWITHYWNTIQPSGLVSEFTRAEQISTPHQTNAQPESRGVAVTLADNHVWVANSTDGSVSRLDQNGDFLKVIALGNDGLEPTGVAVDSTGKVWASCMGSHTIKRIDPDGDTDQLGAVDLTVPLGDGAAPYNYSDMTGMVGLHATATGTWIVTHDGWKRETPWCRVMWNTDGCTPPPSGTELQVDVRAADRATDLAAIPYQRVPSSGALLSNIIGRFIQVRVRFLATVPGVTPYQTPVLCDLAVLPNVDCLKGDVNFDGLTDGRDIQAFVNVLLGNPASIGPATLCAADTNYDGRVRFDDSYCFIGLLLDEPCADPCAGRGGPNDCNGNGVDDIADLISGTSQDCNGNWIPDECDIDPNDPDGNELVSNDLNENGVPDECEPDCNSNGVPDAWDISQETSADCNANGIPDECELDCNDNGVPDDCDIDPNDPDGNEEVSPDCNGNQRPDECDIALGPPWGSLDCNDNDIPDECDIANCPENDPSCQDCNENGFLDACDIAAEISLDEDEDGIPDECEGENLMGGGGGMMQQEMFGNDDLFFGDLEAYWAAWDEYFDWAMQQGWGPNSNVSGAEQFRAMADKLRELGLPVQDPWMSR